MSNPHNPPRRYESEIVFVITNKWDDIAGDIAGLTSILEYDLKPKPSRRIHDTYYDTRRGLLRNRNTSLRLRRIDGDLLVSLKSNPARLNGKGVRRVEIEAPWSRQFLDRIQGMLKNPRSEAKSPIFKSSPSATLTSIGLKIVQERKTRRLVRDILHHDNSEGKSVAEIDIDKVTFLGDPKIRLFEVEIEAKTGGSMKRIQEITEALQSSYPGFLKEWPHGKLTTGLAIRKLFKSGVLHSYLEHGKLKAEAFPVIEKSIQSSSAKHS